ncbi:unnamed protein product [marine sediment metagenome]|uniref:Uncharacterized protein n=1 Tax=marine sediment metagenome TaxID=412755 RepID=X1HMX4_9ZZZZ
MSNVLKLKEVVKEYKKAGKTLDEKLNKAEESQRQARKDRTGTQNHPS